MQLVIKVMIVINLLIMIILENKLLIRIIKQKNKIDSLKMLSIKTNL